ncbi:hypothetical protein [Nocardioides zeae]
MIGTDATATAGGIGSGNYTNNYVYAPTQIYGAPYSTARTARVAATGDSIMRGFSQTGDDDGLNILDPMQKTSVVNIGSFGEYAAQFALPAGHRRRIPDVDGCTAWHCNYGINDLKGSHVYANLQAAMVSCWRVLAERIGVPGYQWTIGPQTTSTDTWATVANQTIVTANNFHTDRLALNAWLRDGAPINRTTFAVVATGSSPTGTIRAGQAGHPLAGIFEVADIVESARDSGLFKAGYTFDGIHYGTSAYAAVAAGLDWTRLGIS